MTNIAEVQIRTLSPSSRAEQAGDIARDMTDGTFEVVAVEVFDHPWARHEISDRLAEIHGVDPGTSLGAWLIGPAYEVAEVMLNEGWEDFEIIHSFGGAENYEGETFDEFFAAEVRA